jgi:Holliday junction resolvase-like predicted endonuclease
VAAALEAAGIPHELHDDHLPKDAPDEAWIALCAERGWLAVTRDQRIRYRAGEIGAIVEHRASVFVVRAKNATGADVGEVLVATYARMQRFARKHAPPFVVGIDRAGRLTRYSIDSRH